MEAKIIKGKPKENEPNEIEQLKQDQANLIFQLMMGGIL